MPSTPTNIEASGNTVDEAVAEALRQLDANREQVDIKVVDEGAKGFLGLMGKRKARVFVSLKKRTRGGRADDALYRALAERHDAVYAIGDCYQPRDIELAVTDGHRAAVDHAPGCGHADPGGA